MAGVWNTNAGHNGVAIGQPGNGENLQKGVTLQPCDAEQSISASRNDRPPGGIENDGVRGTVTAGAEINDDPAAETVCIVEETVGKVTHGGGFLLPAKGAAPGDDYFAIGLHRQGEANISAQTNRGGYFAIAVERA